jgi:hypothetical protein
MINVNSYEIMYLLIILIRKFYGKKSDSIRVVSVLVKGNGHLKSKSTLKYKSSSKCFKVARSSSMLLKVSRKYFELRQSIWRSVLKNLKIHETKINHVKEVRMTALSNHCKGKISNEKCTNKNKKFINHYELVAVWHEINDHLTVSLCCSKAASKPIACEDTYERFRHNTRQHFWRKVLIFNFIISK